jgi:hypothetical protein
VNPALTLAVSGTATAVNLNPTAMTFAPQLVGTASPNQTMTLTNVGTTALIISSVSNAGGNTADFTFGNGCPIGGTGLAAGGSCRISVKFAPTAAGLRSTSLTIASSDKGLPSATVPLSGTGLQAGAVLSPASLSFGTVTHGQSSTPKSVTLTNTGNTTLTISSISIGGTNAGQFSQTNNCPASLATNASCTITVVFSPKGTGAFTASVLVKDNAPASPQSVTLTGTGQ